MLAQIHDLLLFLIDRYGHEAVANAVATAMDVLRRRRVGIMKMDAFLDRYHARADYRFALKIKRGRIRDVRRLAQSLLAVNMPLDLLVDFHRRFMPWDSWIDESEAAVVFGGRYVTVPEGPQSMRSFATGARDILAQDRLERILRTKARLVYRTQPHILSSGLPRGGAEAAFDRICTPQTKVVFIVGSPLVNPLADVAARRIFRSRDELPALFRWSFPVGGGDSLLVEPRPCRRGEEGIRQKGHGETTWPHMRDEEVMRMVAASATLPAGPFPDAALLVIDATHDPILVLCMGHGGLGTVAAVLALGDVKFIERALLDAKLYGLRPGVLVQPVAVVRTKPTREPVDDLELDLRHGWSLPWKEERDLPRDDEEDLAVAV